MVTYVVLMNLTDHGVQSIKNAPARIEQTIRSFEVVGGKIVDFYVVMGDYDFICVVEAPTDEAVMSFSLKVSSAGNVKTTTLKAFTRQQFTEAVQDIDQERVI